MSIQIRCQRAVRSAGVEPASAATARSCGHNGDLVRFFVAVLVGGAAVGALMPGMPAFELLSRASLLRTLLLLLAGLLIGIVVVHRGWLAAAAAYTVGVTLWMVLYLRPSPPWAPSDNWFIDTWISFVGTQLAGTLLFTAIGYIGERVARVIPGQLRGHPQAR